MSNAGFQHLRNGSATGGRSRDGGFAITPGGRKCSSDTRTIATAAGRSALRPAAFSATRGIEA